jgi:hypothetical protein
VSLALIAGAAAGALIAFLLLVELATWLAHRTTSKKRFLSTVILGQDKRTSTSKTFILMWTLLVSWALIALLISGVMIHRHTCVPPSYFADAAQKCKRAGNQDVGLLQVGWLHFLHSGLSGSYLVLLGVPAAAGVAAKGITQSQASGSGFKAANNTQQGLAARITDIFSADDGTTDIGDFQYMIFNLVAAAYFVAQFLSPDGSGLPAMPDTLLGLTSVSATLYVGKKAVTQSQPSVTGVFPQPIQADKLFTIVGVGLSADPGSETDVPPQVSIDGVPALNVSVRGETLTAVVPSTLGGGGTPITRQLQVKNPYNGITPNFSVQCL